MYIIRDREAGNIIEKFDDLEQAKETLKKYIENDINEGIYEKYFYEIYNDETNEILIVM